MAELFCLPIDNANVSKELQALKDEIDRVTVTKFHCFGICKYFYSVIDRIEFNRVLKYHNNIFVPDEWEHIKVLFTCLLFQQYNTMTKLRG